MHELVDNLSVPVDESGVLLVYTGGTVGSSPRDRQDPRSPLIPASFEEVVLRLPNFDPVDKKIMIAGKWIGLGMYSWIRPIDSSNVSLSDWRKLAALIRNCYQQFEGFVIFHGTDTMAYTASVLSFTFRGLSKPVILTGSQLPISESRSDAVQNAVTAIEIAAAKSLGAEIVPEVCIFFRDYLYRGCRTTKLSSSSFNAFCSPNVPPLGEAGERIRIIGGARPTESSRDLQVTEKLEENIASIEIFPGMGLDLLRNILATEGLKGVVMQTFGAGNAPTTRDFLDVIGHAVERGITIVDITQCRSGGVDLGLYDASVGLLARGVISGLDMTPEAALAKLLVVLGDERDLGRAMDRLQVNLRGEQRQSIWNFWFGGGQLAPGEARCLSVYRSTDEVAARKSSFRLDKAMVRFFAPEVFDDVGDDVGRRVGIEVRLVKPQQELIGIFEETFRYGKSMEPIVMPMSNDSASIFLGSSEQALILSNRGNVGVRWRELVLSTIFETPEPVEELES